MNTNPEQDALRSRWTLEGRIPLSSTADGAEWRRARSVATGQSVVLFIVRGEAALEAADAVRRAYLVEDPHLLPVQEIIVLDDPREDTSAVDDPSAAVEPSAASGPTTVVEYPMPPAPPLAALLAKGPLHPETARAIIGEVATGLETARRRGVRHQFIDSNRVFVDVRTGSVSVLGIGVEAAAHPGLDRSREIASFQDTAALVALLYRALTGRSPQHDAAGNVPRPSTMVDTEIPADLDLLCDLVLNESSDEIPETTRGLIEALEPWQSIPVTLEAYPRTAQRNAGDAGGADNAVHTAPEKLASPEEPTAAMGAVVDDEPTSSPSVPTAAPAAAAPAVAATGDELESTALMDAVPAQDPDDAPGPEATAEPAVEPTADAAAEDLPVEDTVARPAAASPAPAPDRPSAGGVAGGVVGTAGAAGGVAAVSAAGVAATSDRQEGYSYDGYDGADTAEGDAETPETATPTPTADDGAAKVSAEAKSLIRDLQLDEKRGTSPFPGHLDITPPRRPEPEPHSAAAAAPASGAPSAAGAAVATGAAGAVAAGGAAESDIPARTSGTQWPLSASQEQGTPEALAPTPARTGSAGRAQQPTGTADAPTPDHDAPTPSSAAPESTEGTDSTDNADSGAPAAPSPVVGRAAPVVPDHHDGPIVVHGRDRSLLESRPEERTVPSAHSSLLRDVVGVAVDTDAPGTFTMGPRDQEKRSLQSQWIIIGGAILVMIALVFAVTSISRGIRAVGTDPLATSQAPTSAEPAEETGEAPVEPTAEATEEPELPAPEVTGVELFAEGSDREADHADQQDRLTDGDPSTFWSTKHYGSPDYGGLKEGVGIRLNFAEPSQVTSVTVATSRNQGGTLELRALNDDGSLGDVLASGELVADGEVRLEPAEPVDADKVALWIPQLPPDSNESGRFRARIAEIQVE